jgi:hypothetical protein
MKKEGFQMPNKKATLAQAVDWLQRNPGFTWASAYRTY